MEAGVRESLDINYALRMLRLLEEESAKENQTAQVSSESLYYCSSSICSVRVFVTP